VSVSAAGKSEARDSATKQAIEELSKRCYTIKVKARFIGEEGATVGEADIGAAASKPETLGEDNVGHRLLKMMGWKGGGLGAGGAGISEPVTAAAVRGREGLGANVAGPAFRRRVRRLIEEYAASDNPYDLIFASDFDNDQRKEMHAAARRLGLKSRSFGKGEERFLTISRKTDVRKLISELLSRGGQNEKYELVPPQK